MKIKILVVMILAVTACNTTEPPTEEKWQISGPVLFVSNKSGTMQLYSMNLEGTDVKQLTDDPNFPITDAKWSPNGKMIVLIGPSSTENKYGPDIYIVNADGTNKRKITGDALDGVHYGSGLNPNWSNDSKSLVFSRLMYPEAIGNTDIYTINIDGTNEKRITSTISISEMLPSYSCDNQNILAMSIHWNTVDSTGNSIQHFTTAIFDLDGNIMSEFGIAGEGWYVPIWSHDCSKIIFTLSNKDFKEAIYCMNYDGTDLTRISFDNYKFYHAVIWTIENKIIYNSTDSNYYNKIFIINSDGSGIKDITPFEAEIVEVTSVKSN